jgi:hypothetical protein
MIELLARQHETELRRSACRHGLDRPGRRRGRRRSVRHRAGWALVAIGLKLARGSGRAGSDVRNDFSWAADVHGRRYVERKERL